MSRDIKQEICLEFEKGNKNEVLNLLEDDELLDAGKIREQGEDYLILEVMNYDFGDDDFFDDYKKVCSYISKGEYECIDELCFIWEKE